MILAPEQQSYYLLLVKSVTISRVIGCAACAHYALFTQGVRHIEFRILISQRHLLVCFFFSLFPPPSVSFSLPLFLSPLPPSISLFLYPSYSFSALLSFPSSSSLLVFLTSPYSPLSFSTSLRLRTHQHTCGYSPTASLNT